MADVRLLVAQIGAKREGAVDGGVSAGHADAFVSSGSAGLPPDIDTPTISMPAKSSRARPVTCGLSTRLEATNGRGRVARAQTTP